MERTDLVNDIDNGTDADSDMELLTIHNRSPSRRISAEEAEHLKALRRIKEALSKFDLSGSGRRKPRGSRRP
jgi:hypothetical protein